MLSIKSEPTVYSTGTGYHITVGLYFLYEISIYRIFKDRAECLGSKFYKLKKPLCIKKKSLYKRDSNCVYGKFIDWITAPEEYIINNNFKLLENVRTNRKNSRNKNRQK